MALCGHWFKQFRAKIGRKRYDCADGNEGFYRMSISEEDFVTRAYFKILGRHADRAGLDYYLERLATNQIRRRDLISELINSDEFKSSIPARGRCKSLWIVSTRAPAKLWEFMPLIIQSGPSVQPEPTVTQEPKMMRDDRTFPEQFEVPRDGKSQRFVYTDFFRGEVCNFGPELDNQGDEDFVERFVLKGHAPATPIVMRKSKVTAFGSCFAINITKHLSALGFDLSKNRDPDIYVSSIDEGLVNVFSILSQFEWALEGVAPQGDLWHGPHAKPFPPDENIRLRTKEIFETTDIFVVTFGLSEIWYDEVTGGKFWRAVPMQYYDPKRHKFRVCTHQETLAAICRIYELIRKHTKAKIIFTLSPIPLIATFRPQSCMTANSVSKAILRSALDEFFRSETVAADENCFYFPAYEMVSELFPGKYTIDGRHPHDFVIDAIMQIFEAFYCETKLSRRDAETNFKKAQWRSVQFAQQSFVKFPAESELNAA